MPSDDYVAFSGGGALKLKGGKVSKSKKKKKDKTAAAGLERALSTGESSAAEGGNKEIEKPTSSKKKIPRDDEDERPEEDDERDEPIEYKTEAQKRHEEYKRKKVRHSTSDALLQQVFLLLQATREESPFADYIMSNTIDA